MTYMIHGATGAQGGPLFARLLNAGKKAVAAVRDPDALDGKPAVALDNGSVDSLVAAYRDADGVFVHLPQAPEVDRVRYAKNIVEAIKTAKPKRVVMSTSGGITVDQPGSPLQAADDSAVAILVRGIRKSDVSHAIVAPRLYLENLCLPMVFGPARSEGILRYPVRADFPVSWSSHLDIAEVVEKLFDDPSVSGVIGVGHLPGLKGANLAEGFAQHFGHAVTFEALSPDAFGQIIEPIFGPAAAPIVGLYGTMNQAPDNVIAEDTSAQRLLGLTPRSVKDWLAQTSV